MKHSLCTPFPHGIRARAVHESCRGWAPLLLGPRTIPPPPQRRLAATGSCGTQAHNPVVRKPRTRRLAVSFCSTATSGRQAPPPRTPQIAASAPCLLASHPKAQVAGTLAPARPHATSPLAPWHMQRRRPHLASLPRASPHAHWQRVHCGRQPCRPAALPWRPPPLPQSSPSSSIGPPPLTPCSCHLRAVAALHATHAPASLASAWPPQPTAMLCGSRA